MFVSPPEGPRPDPLGADLIVFLKAILSMCGELEGDEEDKSTEISSGLMTPNGCLDFSFSST